MTGVKVCDRIIDMGLSIFAFSVPFSTTLADSGYVIALLGWTTKGMVTKQMGLRRTLWDLPILAFAGVSILSIFTSVDFYKSIPNLKKVMLFILVYLLVTNISQERQLRRYLTLLIISSSIIASGGIWNYLNTGARAHFGLDNNSLAQFLSMVMAFCVSFFLFSTSKLERFFLSLAMLPMAAAIILTFSRSAWLGLVGATLLMVGLKDKKRLLVVPVLVLVVLLLSPRYTWERSKSIVNLRHPDNIERLYMWESGLKIFRDYPITGVGVDAIERVYSRYVLPQAKERMHNDLHNDFLQQLVEKGILGLITYTWLVIALLKNGCKVFRKLNPNHRFWKALSLGCLGVYVSFIIDGLFQNNLFIALIVRLFWFTLGLNAIAWTKGRVDVKGS